ncbi:MAG TPA: hypothetical protein VHG51_10680 [Longimicrobiaceae bacterium]|nr:hypothetical protein [Longimicrobiaceae bacterium]
MKSAKPRRSRLGLRVVLAAVLGAAGACRPEADPERRPRAAAQPAWSAPDVVALPPGTFSPNDHLAAALIAGPRGSLHALFLDDADGDRTYDRLLHAARTADGWSRAVVLRAGVNGLAGPELVAAPGGAVHALWQESEGGGGRTRVVHRVLGPEGGEWAPAADGPGDSVQEAGAQLAAAWDGRRTHVLWGSTEGLRHLALTDGGPPVRDTLAEVGTSLALAAAPDGTLAVAGVRAWVHPVFASASESAGNVWVRLRREGRWLPPERVHHVPRDHAYFPQLAWDRAGRLHALWLQGSGSKLPTRVLHSVWAGRGSWSPAADLLPDGAGRIVYSPRLAVDGGGRVHATFARFRNGVSDPEHLHAAWDGRRWSRPVPIRPDAGARDSELLTAVDPQGRVHALWEAADGTYRHAVLREA